MLSRGEISDVDSQSLRQQPRRTRSSRRTRRAVWCTTVGAGATFATVVMGAIDAVSAQQAIALALPAHTITLVGLLQMSVPDAWTAWRRGFQHGCQAALRSQADGLMSRGPAEARREVRLADPASEC